MTGPILPAKPAAERQSAGDVVNLPDLSAEGDEVGGPPDEFERGRLVQTLLDNGEPTLSIDLEQLAGVRVRWRTIGIAGREFALCQGEEIATRAELHVHE